MDDFQIYGEQKSLHTTKLSRGVQEHLLTIPRNGRTQDIKVLDNLSWRLAQETL